MQILEYCSYKELEAVTDGFSLNSLIGKGSHGSVYKAKLKKIKGSQAHVVAVKKLSNGLQILHDYTRLENELQILYSLPKNSPHFVNILGHVSSHPLSTHDDQSQKLIVMEFMPNGTLHDMLHLSTTTFSKVMLRSLQKRATLALQIAKSIDSLHKMNPPLIHRDIKSTNILFDSKWRPRLADFGLAVGNSSNGSTCSPAGTIGYIDPYYTEPTKLSLKNDVYSFGVLLLEIISLTRAVDVQRQPSFLVDWAQFMMEDNRIAGVCGGRIRPRDLELYGRPMLGIAVRCVDVEQERRPTMSEVVRELEKVVISHWRFRMWTRSIMRNFVVLRDAGMLFMNTRGRTRKLRQIVRQNDDGDDDHDHKMLL